MLLHILKLFILYKYKYFCSGSTSPLYMHTCNPQVLPGVAWDNLRNLETGLVTSFTYSQCQVTYDRKYLIPDNTFAIPQKTSIVEQNAEIVEHWDSYFSTTARSINSGIDLLGKIGGKFSTEYKRVKSSQYRDESYTATIELRHRFYTITQLPDSALHPGFKRRLLEIASFLKSNDTRTANFLAEVLVRDFGTHYLSSVDAGAVLVQEDNLKRVQKSKSSSRTYDVSASAAASSMLTSSLKLGLALVVAKLICKVTMTIEHHLRHSAMADLLTGLEWQLRIGRMTLKTILSLLIALANLSSLLYLPLPCSLK